jgi:hypothetical protein
LKSHNTEARHHAEIIQTLIHCTNQLPGTVSEIDEKTARRLFFNSFLPSKRCATFFRSDQACKTSDISDIIQFMSNEKLFADAEEARRGSDQTVGRDLKQGRDNSGRYTMTTLNNME